MPVEVMLFGLGWVRLATLPHPYKPLGLWVVPLPHCQVTFLFLSQGLGPSRHFPLANGARSPQQLQTIITSSYDLWCYQATTLSTSTLCVDADGPLACLIQASIKEVMVVLT